MSDLIVGNIEQLSDDGLPLSSVFKQGVTYAVITQSDLDALRADLAATKQKLEEAEAITKIVMESRAPDVWKIPASPNMRGVSWQEACIDAEKRANILQRELGMATELLEDVRAECARLKRESVNFRSLAGWSLKVQARLLKKPGMNDFLSRLQARLRVVGLLLWFYDRAARLSRKEEEGYEQQKENQ